MNLSKNFTRDELCKCRCGCNTYIKINYKLVDCIQKLRDKIGKPLIINSSYRCKNHPLEKNKKSPGQHTLGTALDIKIPEGITKKNFIIIAQTINEFKNGGIGLPIYSNYIHLDIRSKPGKWGYGSGGQIITFEEALKKVI